MSQHHVVDFSINDSFFHLSLLSLWACLNCELAMFFLNLFCCWMLKVQKQKMELMFWCYLLDYIGILLLVGRYLMDPIDPPPNTLVRLHFRDHMTIDQSTPTRWRCILWILCWKRGDCSFVICFADYSFATVFMEL